MVKDERRKSPRVDVDFVTVEIYRDDSFATDHAEICSVVNLSRTGMRFDSDRKFNADQLLKLTFILPESMVIIRVNAKIIHMSAISNEMYSYGVQFTNLGTFEQKQIEYFIQKSLNDRK
ncbi:MAG: PilZ domain-containing protein [Fibrobacter sp.]|nr:PilZ domain-containing protein [Fibrobacter sp.]